MRVSGVRDVMAAAYARVAPAATVAMAATAAMVTTVATVSIGFAPGWALAQSSGREVAVGASSIETSAMMKHVNFLASEDLQGRSAGSEGAAKAAEYIREQFEDMGLEPAGRDGFTQRVLASSGVRVQGVIGLQDLNRGYEYNVHYTPLGMSADGHHTGDLVFAGYGITAPDLDYDDYAGLDVTGKIVLAFLGEPGMRDPDSPFDGTSPTLHSDLYRKAEVAREHGAAGLILTPGPLYAKRPDQVWRISSEAGFLNTGIMVVQMGASAAQSLLEPAGVQLANLQRDIDKRYQPLSSDLPNKVEMMVKLRRLESVLTNVIAKIPGRTEDAVVLASHFDGYGMGPDNSVAVLHPGANGNASGVATLIEVARALKKMPQPEKTVYFVALSGHHMTHAGAETLTRSDLLPFDRMTAFVNMHILGTNNQSALHAFGSGSGDGLVEVLQLVNDNVRAPVELKNDKDVANVGDHIPFYKKDVPVLTFFGGATGDIGTPMDTPDKIHLGSLGRNARYIYGVVRALSQMDKQIAFRGQ